MMFKLLRRRPKAPVRGIPQQAGYCGSWTLHERHEQWVFDHCGGGEVGFACPGLAEPLKEGFSYYDKGVNAEYRFRGNPGAATFGEAWLMVGDGWY